MDHGSTDNTRPESSPTSSSTALDLVARTTGWRPESVCDWRDGMWVGSGADTAYSEDHHAVIDAATGSSWWYETRADMIMDLLDECGRPSSLWEIGAGSGTVACELNARGVPVVAVEPGYGGARTAAAAGVTTFCATLQALDLPDLSLPAVGLFDVLEHVEDRPGLLAELRRVLQPGGTAVFTVPAYRWLWSDADVVVGHTTRYTRGRLVGELEAAGFRSQHAGYRFASLVLPVAVLRSAPYRLGRSPDIQRTGHEVSRGFGPLGRSATWAERHVGRHLPFGTSVFGVFRTPRR